MELNTHGPPIPFIHSSIQLMGESNTTFFGDGSFVLCVVVVVVVIPEFCWLTFSLVSFSFVQFTAHRRRQNIQQ